MSSWRVSRHYGFGAARIPIQPEVHRAARPGLREAVAELSAELIEGGPIAMLRRVAGQSPAMLLGLLLMVSFVVTVSRDHSDFSPIEVVFFESAPVEPELLPEPIPPPVALVQAKPAEALVSRPPPLEVLVERPKPAPPVQRRRAPKPPPMPRIARVENRPPPSAWRSARPDPSRPAPVAMPQVSLDAVAHRSPRSTHRAPSRPARQVATARAQRPETPRLAPVSSLPSEVSPPRGFRVATASTASPARRPQAKPGFAAAPRPAFAPTAPPSSRVRVDAPQPTHRARSISPALAPTPALALPEQVEPASRREDRPAPASRARREPSPVVSMVGVSAGLAPRAMTAPRVARQEALLPQGESASSSRLLGVPLGNLWACVSDREEDRLKQAVAAAVTTQKECVSRAGTYRFVETKNLNSFLMWIDGVSGRAVGDRCDELRYAIECLQGAGQQAAR